jgi:predicted dehydrogenase
MPPIKIGVVGLSKEGWASQVLVPPLFQQPLSEKYLLTAVSTRSEASANESAKKYSEIAGHQVTPYYGDTTRISQDPNVELVAVSVTCPQHRQALLPAIAAGKDVFVEWPAGNGLKEATEIAQAAREKGVRTMVGTQGRQSPTIRKVRPAF